jgi:hypothetical protein
MLVRTLAIILVLGACKGAPAKKAQVGCDLSGSYRTQFDVGVGQWLWFRFSVDPGLQHAKLELPAAFDPRSPLTIDPDPAACKLSVTAKTGRGDLLASLTLDPKTQKVTGKLRRPGGTVSVELKGVHDPTSGPAQTRACLKPGRYQLVVPAEQTWHGLDGGKCDTASLNVPFLLEELGDKVSIDQLDDDGNAAWAAEDYAEEGPCKVLVRFRHEEYMTLTELTFGGDVVTAVPKWASVTVLENGDPHRCQIWDPVAWVEELEPHGTTSHNEPSSVPRR